MSTDLVLPLVAPQDQDWPVLWKLADRLRELGYTEQNISAAMELSDHATRNYAAWPAHVRNCRKRKASEPYALLAAFFLIEESLEESELKSVLGSDVVDTMARLEWLARNGSQVYFRYFLYPLLGAFFLTDGHVSNPNCKDQVYMLGTDSHCLARLAPRPGASRALDHCTGSGVHAVLAGRHTERAFGLDINPRALAFSRLNARWNRIQNVSFIESDCYQNVRPEVLQDDGPRRFDLITANPPFVPTPVNLQLCRGGGISGEDVTEKIVRGLPDHLGPEGVFSMITNVPVFADQTFFDRCEAWLDKGSTWGMAMLSYHKWSIPSYVLAHHTPSPSESYGDSFLRWLEAFDSVKLESMLNSQVYLFRSSHPWRIDRRFDYPIRDVSAFIESWLASLRAYGTGKPASYRLHGDLQSIWWADDGGRVFLEWKPEQRWWQPQGFWLEGPAARAVEQLRQHPNGCPGDQVEPEGLERLLEDHLATLCEAAR